MVADELAAFIAGAGLGLTTAAPTPNLFARPFPLDAPDKAVAIDVFDGKRSDRVFGTGKTATVGEHPVFHVFIRDNRDNDAAAAALAYQIYDLLDNAGPVVLSSVLYRDIKSLDGPPKFLSADENKRPTYVLRCEADKDRS